MDCHHHLHIASFGNTGAIGDLETLAFYERRTALRVVLKEDSEDTNLRGDLIIKCTIILIESCFNPPFLLSPSCILFCSNFEGCLDY